MTRAISKAQFILLFIYVIFIAHMLAEPPEVVKNEFMAWRKRSHEARFSARTNRSLESLNVTGFQQPQDSLPPGYSQIWAGAFQNNPPSGIYSNVSAVWSIPYVTWPPGPRIPGVWGASVWAGIDGSTNSSCPNTLLQAGTYSYLVALSNGNFYEGVLVWYEWYPASAVYLSQSQYPATILDPISISIEASTQYQATVVFTNTYTDFTATIQVNSPNSPGDDICGGTAEWILEKSKEFELAQFGDIYMQRCQAKTTLQDSVNLDGATLITMLDSTLQREIAIVAFANGSDLTIAYVGP